MKIDYTTKNVWLSAENGGEARQLAFMLKQEILIPVSGYKHCSSVVGMVEQLCLRRESNNKLKIKKGAPK